MSRNSGAGALRHSAALSPGFAGFFRRPLVRVSGGMGGFAAFAGNLALLSGIHPGKTTTRGTRAVPARGGLLCSIWHVLDPPVSQPHLRSSLGCVRSLNVSICKKSIREACRSIRVVQECSSEEGRQNAALRKNAGHFCPASSSATSRPIRTVGRERPFCSPFQDGPWQSSSTSFRP